MDFSAVMEYNELVANEYLKKCRLAQVILSQLASTPFPRKVDSDHT